MIEGQIADPRSDVYALGMTLYYALVGYVPKGAEPQPSAGRRSPAGHHPREKRADVPEWLDEIIARATRAEPGHRLETAERFARALAERSLESRADESQSGQALRVCVLCRAPGNARPRGVPALRGRRRAAWPTRSCWSCPRTAARAARTSCGCCPS